MCPKGGRRRGLRGGGARRTRSGWKPSKLAVFTPAARQPALMGAGGGRLSRTLGGCVGVGGCACVRARVRVGGGGLAGRCVYERQGNSAREGMSPQNPPSPVASIQGGRDGGVSPTCRFLKA